MPVRVGSGGLVRLRPSENDPIAAALDDAQVEIRVALSRRTLGAVAPRIGHRAGEGPVVIVRLAQEMIEPSAVVGVMLPVHASCDDGEGVQCVQTRRAQGTPSRAPTYRALPFDPPE